MLVNRVHFLGGHDHGAQEAVGHRVLKCRGALLTLQQKLDATQAALDLSNAGYYTHGVKNVGRWLIAVIALGHRKNEPVRLEG